MDYDDEGMDLEFDDETPLDLVDMIEVESPDERDEVMVWAREATRYYTIH